MTGRNEIEMMKISGNLCIRRLQAQATFMHFT